MNQNELNIHKPVPKCDQRGTTTFRGLLENGVRIFQRIAKEQRKLDREAIKFQLSEIEKGDR